MLGYGAAAMHARRIRRLERAAERIAGGRFDEPVVDPGKDELGELARGFDAMRVQLAQLDVARKEFIANASHELRTPLFSLGGFLELMTDEELDEETRAEFLATMREQVEPADEAGDRPARSLACRRGRAAGRAGAASSWTTSPATLVDELRGARGHARDHPLELDAERHRRGGRRRRARAPDRPCARRERARAHAAGTRVVVRATADGGRAVLSVEDDGPGIPGSTCEQVFDRFYRVDGGVASGSGLGLAIARELAELMGGRVTLESRPGRTVFALELAVAPEHADARRPALV